jgi:RNA polymerase sigma-70 factor (ECF subfamily)
VCPIGTSSVYRISQEFHSDCLAAIDRRHQLPLKKEASTARGYAASPQEVLRIPLSFYIRYIRYNSVGGDMVSFPTTRWSVVLQAAGSDAERGVLSELCSVYWPPVYRFILGKVRDPEQARDMTQAFFLRLLEKHDLLPAHPLHTRFRSFLLASVQHFLSNERDRARAQKRGGGSIPFPLDFDECGRRWEPVDALTPEKVFEREWAATLVDETLQALRLECEAAGKKSQFDALKGCLEGEASGTYDEIGKALGMTEGAVKVAVHRLRRRFRDLLRDKIAGTVAEPADVDDELRYLFSVMSS